MPKITWRNATATFLWFGILAAWTVALLRPIPHQAVKAVGGPDNSFWVGKTLHVSMYAFLSVVLACTPWSRRLRIVLVLVLALHGGLTEFLQQFVGRGASWRDVGLDTMGVIIGVMLTWKRWLTTSSLGYWHGNLNRHALRLSGRNHGHESPQKEMKDHGSRQDEDAAHLRQG